MKFNFLMVFALYPVFLQFNRGAQKSGDQLDSVLYIVDINHF
jgi:hypothetical protein